MTISKRGWAAVTLTAAIALAGCSADPAGDDKSKDGKAGSGDKKSSGQILTIAESNVFTGHNPNHSDFNVVVNSRVKSATTSGFWHVSPQLEVIRDTEIGEFKQISENPLKVEYTVNEKMKWSDGNPIDAGDLLMSWAVYSGWFDDFKKDGDKSTGTKYFSVAGTSDGLTMTKKPVISNNGRTITLEYEKPFADWEIAYDLPSLPAHIVAKRAGMTEEDLVKLITEAPKGDKNAPKPADEKVSKLAKVWNEDWNTDGLPSDPELYLSSGPFIIKEVEPKQSLTLVKNDKFGGTPAKVDEVTVRYITDPSAAVSALRNGEVDVINPKASADTLTKLKELESKGIKTLTGAEMAYTHIDLNSTGVFADQAVREAFLHTIPRQEIVDKVLGGLKPGAKPLDSQIYVESKAEYKDAVAGNNSSKYAKVDIEKAKQLLGGKTPEVRLMYSKGDPNRVDAYKIMRASAEKAGIKLIDGGLPANEWGKALGGGTYDATIFAWISSGVGNGMVSQILKTGGGGNYSKYSNPEVDKLSDQLLVTLDKEEQKKIKIAIDKQLFDTAYGLPVFQSVGVVGHSDRVQGMEYMPNKDGVWWNLEKLSVK